jgi:hypothetical protein
MNARFRPWLAPYTSFRSLPARRERHALISVCFTAAVLCSGYALMPCSIARLGHRTGNLPATCHARRYQYECEYSPLSVASRHAAHFLLCVTFRSKHAVLFLRSRGGMHFDGLGVLSLLEWLSQSASAERHAARVNRAYILILHCDYNKDNVSSRPRPVHEEHMTVTSPSPFERTLPASSPRQDSANADTSAPDVAESAPSARSTLRPACEKPRPRSAPASDRILPPTGSLIQARGAK